MRTVTHSILSIRTDARGLVHVAVRTVDSSDKSNPTHTLIPNLPEHDVAEALMLLGMKRFREQYVIY